MTYKPHIMATHCRLDTNEAVNAYMQGDSAHLKTFLRKARKHHIIECIEILARRFEGQTPEAIAVIKQHLQ